MYFRVRRNPSSGAGDGEKTKVHTTGCIKDYVVAPAAVVYGGQKGIIAVLSPV